jgi:hypothetical protein
VCVELDEPRPSGSTRDGFFGTFRAFACAPGHGFICEEVRPACVITYVSVLLALAAPVRARSRASSVVTLVVCVVTPSLCVRDCASLRPQHPCVRACVGCRRRCRVRSDAARR